jgi:hypothetical protein
MRKLCPVLVMTLALLWPARPALAQDPGATDYLLANINTARAANGLHPYSLNSLLTAAAQAHSKDVAARAAILLDQGQNISGAITHDGSDGSRPPDRVAATGYVAIQVGENIYSTTLGPEAAFQWWMGSMVHRNNILHERYREIGIGAAPGPEGSVIYTLVFAHSVDSPVLPAPTPLPTVAPPPSAPTQAPLPTETAVPSPTETPEPTATTAHIQLPAAVSATPIPTAHPTPEAGSTAGAFARDAWRWVILLEAAAAAVAIYTFVRVRQQR